jgi:hypothetical protein
MLQNLPQQIEVLNHRGENLTTKHTKDTKRNLAAQSEQKFTDHPRISHALLAFPKKVFLCSKF